MESAFIFQFSLLDVTYMTKSQGHLKVTFPINSLETTVCHSDVLGLKMFVPTCEKNVLIEK